MPSFRSPKEQAQHAVSQRVAFKESRHDNKGDGMIHAVGTARGYQQSLAKFAEFVQENRLGDLKSATPAVAQAYLAERQESGLSQKTIDLDRQALQCHLQQSLERVHAIKETHLGTRSYPSRKCTGFICLYDVKNVMVAVCNLNEPDALTPIRPTWVPAYLPFGTTALTISPVL